MDRRALLICLFLAVAARASTVDGTPPAEPLPGVAPSEPAEAFDSFRTRPGFQIELVVSEPLVRDPVAIDFDQQGRMYVVELPTYGSSQKRRNIAMDVIV